MSKQRKIAKKLLSLLEEYKMALDKWEDHLKAAANGFYKTKAEERNAHCFYQEEFLRPVMKRCEAEGFRFVDLMEMLPGPFKTTYEDREAVIADLKEHMEETYV